MSTSELNRREIICGAGALAAGGAAPSIITVGSLLTPQIASAQVNLKIWTNDTVASHDVISTFTFVDTYEGKKYQIVQYKCTSDTTYAILRYFDNATGRLGDVSHVQRLHWVAGKHTVSFYKYCAITSPSAGNILLTFPTQPGRRILKPLLPHDANGNGEYDYRPTISWPPASNDLKYYKNFDSRQAWDFDALFYKTFNSAGQDFARGALKRGVENDVFGRTMTIDWIGFTAFGANRTTCLGLIDKYITSVNSYKALNFGSHFSSAVAVLCFVVGAGVYLTSGPAAPVLLSLCTLTVLGAVNSSNQASAATVKLEDVRLSFNALENWALDQPNKTVYSK